MNSAIKKPTEIVNDLPEESQAEVIDFAEFLREKNADSSRKHLRRKKPHSFRANSKVSEAQA